MRPALSANDPPQPFSPNPGDSFVNVVRNQRSTFAQPARWCTLILLVVAGLGSLVGSGGGGGGGGDTPAALTVISTSPTNGATGVATATTVSATFSENLSNTPTMSLVATGGAPVTGTVSRTGSTTTFTPAAALAAGTNYTATVSGATGAGGGTQSGSSSWNFTTAGTTGTTVTISGTAEFQSVPNNTAGNGGLLYGNTTNKPIRGATVELVAAGGGAVLATGTTSSTGTYALTLPAPQSVIVRVRAEMKKTSGAGGTWDFTVRDNTQSNLMYALDTTAFTPAVGGNTRNLLAASGWGGASYTGTRSAGPFAILDTVYDAVQKVLSASANAAFPPLQLMWSVNNQPAGNGSANDLAAGLIGTSFFSFSNATGYRIYILGFADTDTDEYDRAVIAHEFGHYFQSVFSRDDSVGGSHSGGERLDMRVAFSEGWGNAWAGMALNTQFYTDSALAGQQGGFRLNLAAPTNVNPGWYNEATVQYLLYTWHADASIGWVPIFNVLANMRTTLPAEGTVSSLHHFAHYLKQQVPGQAAAINTLLAGQQIVVADARGSTETNGSTIAEALPVYRTHAAAIGVAQNYCLTDAAVSNGVEFNKLGANLFIRFTLGASGTRAINITGTTAAVTTDPDFTLIRNDGTKTDFEASAAATENTGNISLAAGTHLIVLYDFALTLGAGSGANNGQRCFNVTIQ